MGRRSRRRQREPGTGEVAGAAAQPTTTTDYTDAEGTVLTLRDALSAGPRRQIEKLEGKAAANAEDLWQRRAELLFERLATSWTIAGLPLTSQKELLGRYRMAGGDEREWIRRTLDEHVRARMPDAT